MSPSGTAANRPQIYLVTPPDADRDGFADRLAAVLDTVEVACLRLRLATTDEGQILRTADRLRLVAHARDIPLVIDSHVALATRAGLDGVHLPAGGPAVRAAREALGRDAIVGAGCGTSRHAGLVAGEAGADYVAFGPVGESALGLGERAADELFEWWSEMIELPVVAEGAIDAASVTRLAQVTDFFAIGDEIWQAENAGEALRSLTAALG